MKNAYYTLRYWQLTGIVHAGVDVGGGTAESRSSLDRQPQGAAEPIQARHLSSLWIRTKLLPADGARLLLTTCITFAPSPSADARPATLVVTEACLYLARQDAIWFEAELASLHIAAAGHDQTMIEVPSLQEGRPAARRLVLNGLSASHRAALQTAAEISARRQERTGDVEEASEGEGG